MLALKPPTPAPFPWQQPRACHDDRAMGLELELIELVRCRDEAVADGASTERLDAQIDDVMAALAREASHSALS
jgi:hypothetical protein